jgi:outer membrane protein assembly factor BamB
MDFSEHVLYVAFNERVFALDRRNGNVRWRWKVPQGGSFVTLLSDGDQLIVCSDGYLWALRAQDGTELWAQPFKGEGTGIPVLASPRSAAGSEVASAVAAVIARARAQSSAPPQHAPGR